MIHNHHQNTRIRSITDRLCCIVVKEIKIFFNLANNYVTQVMPYWGGDGWLVYAACMYVGPT